MRTAIRFHSRDAIGVRQPQINETMVYLKQLPLTNLWNWSSGSARTILKIQLLNRESTKTCVFPLLGGIKAPSQPKSYFTDAKVSKISPSLISQPF